ncbi:MAG: hypothetical protein A2Y76_13325 [Planctomycetes bacterium RBG_13_60_9]|nr:MAG: hypothetical protein A2Y76_13325 [Planctomycetes bacterium RBG_13_60_9]
MNQGRGIRSATTFGLFAILMVLITGGTATADCCCPGTGSPGYWMNHPEAWPQCTICIGEVSYCKDRAIELMKAPTAGDKTCTLFQALVAAKLNVLIGNCSCCIDCTISQADTWLIDNPLKSNVRGNSCAWKCGEPLYCKLDAYNNGQLCAPSRDELEADD